MIDFIYELPGGCPIYVQCELAEEAVRIIRCKLPMGYDLDPEKIWIDTGEIEVGLLPLTLVLKQEAGERGEVML